MWTLLPLLLALAGCSIMRKDLPRQPPEGEAAGRAAAPEEEPISPWAYDLSKRVRDAQIAIASDPDLAERMINVDTDGKSLRLYGEAHSPDEKKRAEELARGAAGGLPIRNELVVFSPTTPQDDVAIESRTSQAIAADPAFGVEDQIDVSVSDGIARLGGVVSTSERKALAGRLALHQGARSVDNRLEVRGAPG